MIGTFRGKWRFLSNFHPAKTYYEGHLWPTSEHAYQAAKTREPHHSFFKELQTPVDAKRYGRRVPVRHDWEEVKVDIMYRILLAKFIGNRELRLMLVATGDERLVEVNTWGDRFWGVCDGEGLNHLGRLLERVRGNLRPGSAQ